MSCCHAHGCLFGLMLQDRITRKESICANFVETCLFHFFFWGGVRKKVERVSVTFTEQQFVWLFLWGSSVLATLILSFSFSQNFTPTLCPLLRNWPCRQKMERLSLSQSQSSLLSEGFQGRLDQRIDHCITSIAFTVQCFWCRFVVQDGCDVFCPALGFVEKQNAAEWCVFRIMGCVVLRFVSFILTGKIECIVISFGRWFFAIFINLRVLLN